MFDRLILMSDGHIVFQGDAKDSTSYFSTMGYTCGLFSNPADYFMKVLSVNYPKSHEDEQRIDLFVQNYRNSNKK